MRGILKRRFRRPRTPAVSWCTIWTKLGLPSPLFLASALQSSKNGLHFWVYDSQLYAPMSPIDQSTHFRNIQCFLVHFSNVPILSVYVSVLWNTMHSIFPGHNSRLLACLVQNIKLCAWKKIQWSKFLRQPYMLVPRRQLLGRRRFCFFFFLFLLNLSRLCLLLTYFFQDSNKSVLEMGNIEFLSYYWGTQPATLTGILRVLVPKCHLLVFYPN